MLVKIYDYSIFSNYILTYNYYFNEKIAFRFGYGQNISNLSSENNSLTNNSSTNSQTSKHSYFYSRLGMSYNNTIYKKWQCFFGIDIVGSYKKSNYISKVDNPSGSYSSDYESESKYLSYSYGGGPTIGLKLKINERIILSTETNMYFVYTNSIRNYEYKSTSNPTYYYSTASNNSSQTKNKGFQIYLNSPMVIYLTVKF